MTPQEWDQILRRTAQDHRLSGPERAALEGRLGGLTDQQAAALRSRAFDVLRESADFSPAQGELIGWLEDVVKLLHPVRADAAASEALFTPDDDVALRIAGLFRSAKQTADVCVFTITDDRIADAMIAAHGRGVRLRVITDDDKALDLGADVARLRGAGVRVVTDHTPAHMHHKFAVFDRAVLLTGSYNWTRSAQFANSENVVITGERRLIDLFGRHFDRLWTQLGGA